MSRVINTDSTGKKRNQNMRTTAEILRRLSQKTELDEDSKDMAAMMVYCLNEIAEGVDQSASVWEKRDYWMKAEQFRERWGWAEQMAEDLQDLILSDSWQDMPEMMVKLFPYFNDITINKLTRKATLWKGAYRRLMSEPPIRTDA